MVYLKGTATFGRPIIDATVRIYDLDGRKLSEEFHATSENGAFMVGMHSTLMRPLPDEYKIVVSGGTLGGEPFHDQLVRIIHDFDESLWYHVNEVTSLVSAIAERQPEILISRAEEQVKEFLAVPNGFDLISNAMYSTTMYSSHDFSHQSRDAGGLETFIDFLLDEKESGISNHTFHATPLQVVVVDDILIFVATSLGKAVVAEAGKMAFGWAMHNIFHMKTSDETDREEIMGQLDSVSKQITTIDHKITSLTHKVEELKADMLKELNQLEWDLFSKDVDDAISSINNKHMLLQGYAENIESLIDDEEKYDAAVESLEALKYQIKDLNTGIPQDLEILNNRLISSDSSRGMLELWGESVKRRYLSGGSYQDIEDFFMKMVMIEMKGYTLLIEAYNADGDTTGARLWYNHMKETITAQLDQFLSTVEKFVVSVAVSAYFYNDYVVFSKEAIPLSNLLQYEFPNMETTTWFSFMTDYHEGISGYEDFLYETGGGLRIFERADQLADKMLESMTSTPSYGAFTAKILYLKEIPKGWGTPIRTSTAGFAEIEAGLPLTFKNYDTGITYSATGTLHSYSTSVWNDGEFPVTPNLEFYILRYDFGSLPIGHYLLTSPTGYVTSKGEWMISDYWHSWGILYSTMASEDPVYGDPLNWTPSKGLQIRADRDGYPYAYWGGHRGEYTQQWWHDMMPIQ